MKILVVLTGGTIASTVNDKIINVGNASAYRIISAYQERYGSDVVFDAMMPYNILSENISIEHWESLWRVLDCVDYKKYSGIIITHGTDTLAYTSAFLAMSLCHIPIPAVLVSADFPIENPKSNGVSNFADAVDFIQNADFGGVFVSYDGDIHIGTRLISADALMDRFGSAYDTPFGKMNNGKFFYNQSKKNIKLDDIAEVSEKICTNLVLNKKVLVIKPYPAIDYTSYNLSNISAVLHHLYHSCTANSDLLCDFIDECNSHEIPFYISPLKSLDNDLYASVDILVKKGAIPLLRMTDEAAFAKTLLITNEKRIYAEKDLFFETYSE